MLFLLLYPTAPANIELQNSSPLLTVLWSQSRESDWLDQETYRNHSFRFQIQGFGALSIRSELLGGACGGSQPLNSPFFHVRFYSIRDIHFGLSQSLYTVHTVATLPHCGTPFLHPYQGRNHPQHGGFQHADDHAMRNFIPSRGTRTAPSLTRPLHHTPFNHT